MDMDVSVANEDLTTSFGSTNEEDDEFKQIYDQIVERRNKLTDIMEQYSSFAAPELSTESLIKVCGSILSDLEKNLPEVLETCSYVARAADSDVGTDDDGKDSSPKDLDAVREEYIIRIAEMKREIQVLLNTRNNEDDAHQEALNELSRRLKEAENEGKRLENIYAAAQRLLEMKLTVYGTAVPDTWKLVLSRFSGSFPMATAHIKVDLTACRVIECKPHIAELQGLEFGRKERLVETVSAARQLFKKYYELPSNGG